MKKIIYLSFLALASLTGLTSCLDEGEETFSLQKGNFEELIGNTWKVTDSKLYDAETEVYHSDLFNDNRIGTIYVLGDEQDSEVIDPEGATSTLRWSADELEQYLTLKSETFHIESLGREVMVLSRYAEVNGDPYLQKYYLRNLGHAGSYDQSTDESDDTYVVNTDQYGAFSRNGYGFKVPKGAVPKGDNGNVGSVAFSVTAIPLSELPATAPTGVQFVNNTGILANPSNFTFASPLIIDVPLYGNNISQTRFYHWNALSNNWEVVPFSALNNNGTASVSTIELGYFVLGTVSSSSTTGGIKIDKSQLPRNYYYYLTLSPVNGNSSKSIAFTADGQDLYMTNVPLGNYTAQITREKRTNLQTGVNSTETSTVNIPVEVTTALTASGSSLSSFRGWTVINLANVSWQTGRPSYWGEETVTYGTGFFQSTLNWVNYTNSTTDYDLHLTTPNGTEIYYSHKQGDGFELDRDVISDVGNCTENIYSISNNLPKGTYRVSVVHYGGATGRQYNCRVILNGRVVKTYAGITNTGSQEIYKFTIQ